MPLMSSGEVSIRVANELRQDRTSETVAVPWIKVQSLLPTAKPDAIRVANEAGKPYVVQCTALDADRVPEELLFIPQKSKAA